MKSLCIAVSSRGEEQTAREILETTGLDAFVLPARPDDVVEKVRDAFPSHMGIVIAAGRLASRLKKEQTIPLVEVVLTGQDLAVLLSRACEELGHPEPCLALLGPRRMFSDPEPIARLLHAELQVYYIADDSEVPSCVEAARAAGAEMIISDEAACAVARQMGLRTLVMDVFREGLINSIRTAVRLSSALLQEQRRTLELQSLIRYSSDAVFRINEKQEIIFANPRAERALGISSDALIGTCVMDLPGLVPSKTLTQALLAQRSVYSMVLQFRHTSYVASLNTVSLEDSFDGWILTMQEFAAIEDLDERVRQERQKRGNVARARFADFPSRAPRMQALLSDAETYAQYDVPILISGESRLHKSRLAECIHNASMRRQNPYVHVDVGTMPPENQFDLLFGRSGSGDIGLVSQAHKGTLFLLDVHTLIPDCQRQLLSILRNGTFRRKDSLEPVPVSVRLLCSTFADLMDLARQGKWMFQLANTLLGLNLIMPPIREIPEDIPALIEEYMESTCRKLKKQVTIAPEALEHLTRYPWPANLRDIEYFCMRAVMLSPEAEVSLAFVREKLLPDLKAREGAPSPHIVAGEEELRIRQALQKTRHNRSAAADLLGISRSTLWRKMKEFGIA